MDHVASGWNGWKSINIFVPDGETYGVNVVSGALDFFRPILARVVSRGPTICLEGLLRMRGGGWRRMDSGIIFFGISFNVFIPLFGFQYCHGFKTSKLREAANAIIYQPQLVYRPIPLPHHLHPPRSHLKKCSKVDPKMR